MTDAADGACLSRAQVREVDRRAIEDYHIPGIVLMENAGRNAAEVVRQEFAACEDASSGNRFVAIVCGRGNNGGDGFVIARHLSNRRIPVEVFLACRPEGLSGDAAANHEIVARMGLTLRAFDTPEAIAANRPRLGEAWVVVDAVLGTGFFGQVRSPLDSVIEAVNAARDARIVAIDLPSGLDCDTGRGSNATVRADLTVTFVGRKLGFDAPGAAEYTGRVVVADIGAPPEIIQAVLSETGAG